MASNHTIRRRMGITLRMTLFSWIVTLSTLLIFVSLTIPQQKKTFIDNLTSKANSVAVSLHNVAAEAAVNEDFASMVSASQTMLNGDADLEFLILMKNDGFALVNQHTGWRAEDLTDKHWLPEERLPCSTIAVVPFFNRRVFHYAQPFDYSGIRWGWIHVGLSLVGYDRSVTTMYRQTGLFALGCILLGLCFSVLYARQMVRPVLRLRHMVRQISDGDFSVRADLKRRDELGHLAESVNAMVEALLRRDRILTNVSFAAKQFMLATSLEDSITGVMAKLGEAADAQYACIFENHTDDTGRRYARLRHEWSAPDGNPQISDPPLRRLDYSDTALSNLRASLSNNATVSGPVSRMSADTQAFFESRGIRSIIAIPVFVQGVWWGFLALVDCARDRIWSEPEQNSLRAAADMLGATIARQRIQDDLLEAKSTLEQRVQERTRELEDQVAAKQKALADLSKTQNSLLKASRAAGMAEVATGVLHNVGNVLNSVNVSCTLLMEQLRESRMGNVSKVATLMTEPERGLPHFLTEDPRGRQIPEYLTSLAAALQEEHQFLFRETEALHNRIEHIMEIVTLQQSYGRVFGISDTIPAQQLMEDALKLNAEGLARYGIKVQREYQSIPPITVDKHKVVQILLNLIHNARFACKENDNDDKTITLRILSPEPDWVHMEVVDNGVGIHPENMTRIFQHGFTTRKSGHGFGLHSGALAARELGGRLNVYSDGPGCGAAFRLELPCQLRRNK